MEADTSKPAFTILVAPNEDGFGPSSLAYHIVRELLSRRPNCRIIIRTGTKVRYNQGLYDELLSSEEPTPGRVWIDKVHNLIQLEKRQNGRIDPIASLEKFLRYPVLRQGYLSRSLHGAQIVVDIGVPTLARAAADQGIPCFTIFDHSWSLTFQRILLEHQISELSSIYSDVKPSNNLRRAIEVLESDEATTRKVFLFPSPLTSVDYWKHWTRLCSDDQISDLKGFSNIAGALGGPRNDSTDPTFESWKIEARRILHIQPEDKAILISAGGTPIWDQVLPDVVKNYAMRDRELPYHVFVFASENIRGRIEKLGAKLEEPDASIKRRVEQWPIEGCSKVHILGEATNCTYQAIIAGVYLVVSRAGGATVNDALACAVPLLLVPEPGHWQVEAIHRAVVDEGYAVSLPYSEFLKDPVGALDSRITSLKSLWAHISERMKDFQRGREESVVEKILQISGL